MIEVYGKYYSKLNLGCGRDPNKKLPMPWLNVDVDGVACDFMCDIRHLPDSWTGCAEEVRASHVLEHFFLDEMPSLLTEWRRVITPGGTVRVIVPDLAIIAEALIRGVDSKGRKSVSIAETTPIFAQIYGAGYETSKTENPWRHRFLFNENILKELFLMHGFQDARSYHSNEDPAGHYGVQDDSQNPFSLCVIAQKLKGAENDCSIVDV